MKVALNYLADRLSESSTWRGLIFVAVAAGIKISPEHQEALIAAALSLTGAINILRKG
jgi:hypothetical protein